MLVVDGIQDVTMANGLVRIAVSQVGSDGQHTVVEKIAIPASQYGTVVQALTNAGQTIKKKMEAQQKQQQDGQQTAQHETAQQPAADPAEAADNFDFS